MRSPWERGQSEEQTAWQEFVNVLKSQFQEELMKVRAKENKRKKEREVEEHPVVCDGTETKVRVYFKRNTWQYRILLRDQSQ